MDTLIEILGEIGSFFADLRIEKIRGKRAEKRAGEEAGEKAGEKEKQET